MQLVPKYHFPITIGTVAILSQLILLPTEELAGCKEF